MSETVEQSGSTLVVTEQNFFGVLREYTKLQVALEYFYEHMVPPVNGAYIHSENSMAHALSSLDFRARIR